MINEKYNQIVDEAYENYCKSYENQDIMEQHSFDTDTMTKEMFIGKIKTISEFSEKWGLMIEERELCGLERWYLCKNEIDVDDADLYSKLDRLNIPTKLITITYKEEKIEVYD